MIGRCTHLGPPLSPLADTELLSDVLLLGVRGHVVTPPFMASGQGKPCGESQDVLRITAISKFNSPNAFAFYKF